MLTNQIRRIVTRKMPRCSASKCTTTAAIEDQGKFLCAPHGLHHMRMADPNRGGKR